MDLTKLGRTERVLAVVGLLAFIDSFLPWWSLSFGPISTSKTGWGVGFAGWFPLLLLLAIGVIVALPAFGQAVTVRGGYAAFGAAALLATVLILIRWLTYPTASSGFGSAGADFGTYVGLILAIVATVFAYLAFTASGGSLAKFGDSFKSQPQMTEQVGYVPPAGGYQPPAGGYTPPPNYAPPSDQGSQYQPPQQ